LADLSSFKYRKRAMTLEESGEKVNFFLVTTICMTFSFKTDFTSFEVTLFYLKRAKSLPKTYKVDSVVGKNECLMYLFLPNYRYAL